MEKAGVIAVIHWLLKRAGYYRCSRICTNDIDGFEQRVDQKARRLLRGITNQFFDCHHLV
ncbi:hypothetical protein C8N25_1634, partial [Algoriphagus antarcticus]